MGGASRARYTSWLGLQASLTSFHMHIGTPRPVVMAVPRCVCCWRVAAARCCRMRETTAGHDDGQGICQVLLGGDALELPAG